MNHKFFLTVILSLFILSCGSCSPKNNSSGDLNIREQPGIEYCPAFCNKIDELSKTDENSDICLLYLEPTILENDAGVLNCTQFCEYEMKNSIQLNPKCMSQVSRCDQIECASLLGLDECEEIDNVCK